MGLDAVEIVMEVEEAFGIEIPGDRTADIHTVGDLFDIILESHAKQSKTNRVCLSAATFRFIRREVNELVGCELRFRPRDFVDSVIPKPRRRRFWSQLQKQLDAELPALIRPRWLTITLTVSAFGLAIACGVWASLTLGVSSLMAGVPTLIVVGVAFAYLTRPLANRPTAAYVTFGGLTGVVIAHNLAMLSERFGTWSPADVWNGLRVILAEQLNVNPDAVTREARLVEDLGME